MRHDHVPLVSIILPTFNRSKELDVCLASIQAQTCQDFETIILRERGPLARLRNQGLSQAHAPVVTFIDDDVVCSPLWLSSLLRVFRESSSIVGVTGPAVIPAEFKQNRDIFRYRKIRTIFDATFVGAQRLPGYLTCAGTFVPEPDYTYCGHVQFLEACNMAFRTQAIKAVGGFDEAYGGIGDWSEPDLCFRLRQKFGDNCLWFDPQVHLEHRPSRQGAYLLRGHDARQRLANYVRFSRRWVRPTWHHWLYRRFLEGYYLGWQPIKTFFD